MLSKIIIFGLVVLSSCAHQNEKWAGKEPRINIEIYDKGVAQFKGLYYHLSLDDEADLLSPKAKATAKEAFKKEMERKALVQVSQKHKAHLQIILRTTVNYERCYTGCHQLNFELFQKNHLKRPYPIFRGYLNYIQHKKSVYGGHDLFFFMNFRYGLTRSLAMLFARPEWQSVQAQDFKVGGNPSCLRTLGFDYLYSPILMNHEVTQIKHKRLIYRLREKDQLISLNGKDFSSLMKRPRQLDQELSKRVKLKIKREKKDKVIEYVAPTKCY